MEYTLIGNHPSIQSIRQLITALADTAFNVLLLGETGTGKEVVARLLHLTSPRREKRFIKVNCAALPLRLLESELFGYEKGAFTGAVEFKPGKFELASDGVIFLDEIGDMPLVLQAKLLQVLQSGEFTRLGGTGDVKVNAWVISSTNHDLERDMKEGRFREDLYYRLNTIRIELPPLRDRTQDIPLLVEHFVRKHQRDLARPELFTLDNDLEKLFNQYPWPGNVRELSSTLLKLMVGEAPEKIKTDLLSNMKAWGIPFPVQFLLSPPAVAKTWKKERGVSSEINSLKDLTSEAGKFIERQVITQVLDTTGWNKRETVKILKISYKTLFNKMEQLGIQKKKPRPCDVLIGERGG